MTLGLKELSIEEWIEQEIKDNEARGFGSAEVEVDEIVPVPHEDARPHWGDVVARVPPDRRSYLRTGSVGLSVLFMPMGLALAWDVLSSSAASEARAVYCLFSGLFLLLGVGIPAWMMCFAFWHGNVSVYEKGILFEPLVGRRRFMGWGYFMAYRVRGDKRIKAVYIRSKSDRDTRINVMAFQLPDVVRVLAREIKERY